MTIFLLKWTDSDAENSNQFRAYSSFSKAKTAYEAVKNEGQQRGNLDITLLEEGMAITKVELVGKPAVLELLNSLGK